MKYYRFPSLPITHTYAHTHTHTHMHAHTHMHTLNGEKMKTDYQTKTP